MRTSIILAFLLFTANIILAQPSWKLKKEKNGISVYTSKVEGFHHDSFKATMIIEGSINEFIALIKDLDKFESWGYNAKATQLLETSGDTIQIYYNLSSAPFPFSNRDGIYRNIFRWDNREKTLVIDITILHDYMDEKKGVVRVKGNGEWRVLVLDENKLEINFIMNIDPGGSVPYWLTNMFNDEGPYYTLNNMRDIIESNNYEGVTYDFIPTEYQN